MKRFLTAILCVAALAATTLGARAAVTTYMLHDAGISESTDPDGALKLARQRLVAHDVVAAVAGLERYLRIYPQELAVARFLGDLYFRGGDLTHAEATYRNILEEYPFDTDTHHRLCMLDALEKQLDSAIRECEAALPGSVDDLLVLHERRGDLDSFERRMQHAAETRTNDSDVQYEMAEIYDDLRLPGDALAYFDRALAIYPGSTDALNGRGIALLELKDYAASQKTFEHCLSLDKANYACANDLGSLYLDEKRYDDAQIYFDRAHAIAPEAPEAVINLGFLADDLGDRAKGARYYAQALYLWPYAVDAYVDLSYDQVQEGLIDDAEAVLTKGLKIAPQDARMHYLLGIVDEVHGKRADALAEFRLAETSLDPEIANEARKNATAIARTISADAPQLPPPLSPRR